MNSQGHHRKIGQRLSLILVLAKVTRISDGLRFDVGFCIIHTGKFSSDQADLGQATDPDSSSGSEVG